MGSEVLLHQRPHLQQRPREGTQSAGPPRSPQAASRVWVSPCLLAVFCASLTEFSSSSLQCWNPVSVKSVESWEMACLGLSSISLSGETWQPHFGCSERFSPFCTVLTLFWWFRFWEGEVVTLRSP